MEDTRRRSVSEYLAPLAASAFVLLFEWWRGDTYSMWVDEGFTYWTAKLPLGSLIDVLSSREANMGPYYLLMWVWIRIGDSDVWLRGLSALATVATVWGIWVVVRRWSGAFAAGLAAWVYVLTPFVLGWTIQARGYTMAMALTAWALVFAERMGRDRNLWSGVAFGVMVGLAVATQLSTVFVFVGIVIAVLALAPTRQMVGRLTLAGLIACVTFAPFAVAVLSNPDQASWIPRLTVRLFVIHTIRAASGPAWALLIASGWVCVLVAAVRDARFRPYLIAVAGTVTGVAGLALVSVVVRPMYWGRYLVGCVPMAVVAAIGGWTWLWPARRRVVAGGVLALSVLTLAVSFDQTRPAQDGYRAAAAHVTEVARPGDAIVALWDNSLLGLARYLPEGTPTERVIASQDEPGRFVIVSADGSPFAADRLWIVSRDRSPAPELAEWIARTFPQVVEEEWFGLIRLQLRAAPDRG